MGGQCSTMAIGQLAQSRQQIRLGRSSRAYAAVREHTIAVRLHRGVRSPATRSSSLNTTRRQPTYSSFRGCCPPAKNPCHGNLAPDASTPTVLSNGYTGSCNGSWTCLKNRIESCFRLEHNPDVTAVLYCIVLRTANWDIVFKR